MPWLQTSAEKQRAVRIIFQKTGLWEKVGKSEPITDLIASYAEAGNSQPQVLCLQHVTRTKCRSNKQ